MTKIEFISLLLNLDIGVVGLMQLVRAGIVESSYMTKTILQSTTAPRIGKYRAVSQSFLVPFFFLFN